MPVSAGRRLVLNLDKCAMAGECVYNHPAVFGWGDDHLPVILEPSIQNETDAVAAEQAVDGCPSAAISIAEGE